MEHTDIDEGAWPERYVTGRLNPEEQARFEAHFVDCASCLDRLEAAEGLRTGLQVAPTEARPVPHTRRRRWAVRAGWAAGGAAAVGLLAALSTTWQRARRAESELARQHVLVTEGGQLLALARAAGEAERNAREALEASLRNARASPLHVPVLALLTTRGAEVPELELPAEPAPVVLSVEREDPPRFEHYRATLLSASGEQRWQEEARPASREAVVLALHSSLLPPGFYVLLLEGAGKANRWTPVARHAFRAVASKTGR